jgi:hypothetical protein
MIEIRPYTTSKWVEISKTFIVDSWVKWPIVGISAWIHWNEHAWVEALSLFFEELQSNIIDIYRWKLILILEWNEESLKNNKRFESHDLNRIINSTEVDQNEESYELFRSRQIKSIIDESNPYSWLDLHTVSWSITSPYLFSWLNWYKKIAKNLDINNIAINWNNIYNETDELNQWVADYINYIWWNWFTLEAGSHTCIDWVQNSFKAILNFLISQNIMNWKLLKISKDPEKNHVHMEYVYNLKDKFSYKNQIIPKSFSKYKKWDLIGYDGNNWDQINEVFAPFDGYIILPKDPTICIKWKEVFFFWKDINQKEERID